MTNAILTDAIQKRERSYRDAIDVLKSIDEDDPDHATASAIQTLREAVELVACLRRLVPGCTVAEVHKAFGAPGDFGYDTPIGDALSSLYRGEAAR